MVRFLVALLVLACLAVSPVFAASCDLDADGNGSVALKAEPGHAATDSDGKSPAGHHCCTAHAHFGAFERSAYPVAHTPHTSDRLPIAADESLAAASPSPLLEPPARA